MIITIIKMYSLKLTRDTATMPFVYTMTHFDVFANQWPSKGLWCHSQSGMFLWHRSCANDCRSHVNAMLRQVINSDVPDCSLGRIAGYLSIAVVCHFPMAKKWWPLLAQEVNFRVYICISPTHLHDADCATNFAS